MRPALTLLLSALLTIWSSSMEANAEGRSVLRAVPLDGHPGDTIFLSGSGFPPRQREFIVMSCPDWGHDLYGNTMSVVGPMTDSHGQFVRFAIKTPVLHVLTSSSCSIYANVGANPYGVDNPGSYDIRAPDQPLEPCSIHICAKVRTVPIRVRSGLLERILIQGWPGARADVTVTYPRQKPDRRTVVLDYAGMYRLRIRVALPSSRSVQPTLAKVRVHVSLGNRNGSTSATFTVIH